MSDPVAPSLALSLQKPSLMIKVNSWACNGPTVFVVLRDTLAHSIYRADKLLEVARRLGRLHSEQSVD